MRTKVNKSIIIIFSIILLLGILGLVGGILISDYGIKITLIIIGIVLVLLSIFEFIGIIFNYEEIKNDELIIHRLGKINKYNISEIKAVVFKGFIITIIRQDDFEICNVDPRKNGILDIVGYLLDNNVEYIENIGK